jgi:hypothetical protein
MKICYVEMRYNVTKNLTVLKFKKWSPIVSRLKDNPYTFILVKETRLYVYFEVIGDIQIAQKNINKIMEG